MSSLSRPYTLGTGAEEREIIQPLLAMEKRLYSEKRSSSEQQFCKPSNATTGKRDRSWEDIEKTINLNCNCSKGDCLQQLKDGHRARPLSEDPRLLPRRGEDRRDLCITGAGSVVGAGSGGPLEQ